MLATDAALRVARHADQTGWFPVFSDNDVHQFLIREALLTRARAHERALEQEAMLKERVASAENRVADALARHRLELVA